MTEAQDDAAPEDAASEEVARAPRVYRLLSQERRGTLPPWESPQYGDPATPVGTPWTHWLHIGAILLAGLADFGQFFQVVELVMKNQEEYKVAAVVVGFTVVTLYLAHLSGVLLREITARPEPAEAGARSSGVMSWLARRSVVHVSLLVWLGLGVAAFEIRRTVQPASAKPPTLGFGDESSAAPADPHTMQAALLFLALYLATGAVAALGGFRTHDPGRTAYLRGLRARRRAAEQAAASAYQVRWAEADRDAQADELRAAAYVLAEEQQARDALAERLKQTARLLIAERMRDPAVTDVILRPDERPYDWRRTNGYSRSGNGQNGQSPSKPRP